MSAISIKESKKHTLFNPAFIDDYGFTPEEFRVFCRIMRRSHGSEEKCFESIPAMAKTLGISEILVRRALNVLVGCGAITRTPRTGQTDLLDFNTCDKWKPPAELPQIRAKIDAHFKAKDRARKRPVMETTGDGNGTGTGDGNGTGGGYGNDRGVVMETTPKGIPLKVLPVKVPFADAKAFARDVAENIWDFGVRLLKSQGTSEPTARSFVGLLRRDYDEDLIAECFELARERNPTDIRAYIKTLLKEKAPPKLMPYTEAVENTKITSIAPLPK